MRCDVCGKFRREKDLVHHYTPDTSFTAEDIYSECHMCRFDVETRKMQELSAEARAFLDTLKES